MARIQLIQERAKYLYGQSKQASAYIQGAMWSDENPLSENINHLARRAYTNAIIRGKTTKTPSHLDNFFSIFEELKELKEASERTPSEHLTRYTEAAEELADILIACLTELHSRGVDVQQILIDKITYNESRQ